MIKSRFNYFIVITIVIVLGLASRHIQGIPLWIGDVLWALMVFYMGRWLFTQHNLRFVSIATLSFCYLIEISQLYQASWINSIRHTIIGGLVLGEAFEWGDLLCYTIGVGIGILIEIYAIKKSSKSLNGKRHV